MNAYEFGVSERRTFEERLTRGWCAGRITDAQGRKRLSTSSLRARSPMWCGTTH